MITNYIKTAWRNLLRTKWFSLLNITGMAVAMTIALFIGLWIQHELGFEQFHQHKKDLYKVWNRSDNQGNIRAWEITSSLLGPSLKEETPEVKEFARVYWPYDALLSFGDNALNTKGLHVDPAFIRMFSFPLVAGNARHALDDPYAVLITETLAKKLFKDADPLNQIVKFENEEALKVTGVLKDLPDNTEFSFEYLVPFEQLVRKGWDSPSWNAIAFNTYIQLEAGADRETVNEKITNVYKKNTSNANTELFLHPLKDWHLLSRFENGVAVGGKIETVRLMTLIAALIMVVACINYVNLNTARSAKRSREVGIRKTIGAHRKTLIGQYLSESVMVAFFAGLVSLTLSLLCMPVFNQITGKTLQFPYDQPVFWLYSLSFILSIGMLAGCYPAFVLSSFRPIKALKGEIKERKGYFSARKALVVTQFAIALVLIMSALIINQQISHGQHRNIGYNANQLIEVPIKGDIPKNYDAIKNTLIESGAATAVSKTSVSITVDGSNSSSYSWQGKDPESAVSFSRIWTTGDMVSTLGLTLLDGRDIDFSRFPSDSLSCMINESAAKAMGFENPIGQVISFGRKQYSIVGVIKDFILDSPYGNIRPLIVEGDQDWLFNLNIRLNERQSMGQNLKKVEEIFNEFNPAYPFDFRFVNQVHAEKFAEDMKMRHIIQLFAAVAIIIACLGLFGLAYLAAVQRTKEIGVRKVLGASVSSIVALLSKDFVKLVIIAIAIASPIAWWAMNKWLEDFAYRIEIQWWMFGLAGLVAIAVAIFTVASQAVKAAMANPVDSLRDE